MTGFPASFPLFSCRKPDRVIAIFVTNIVKKLVDMSKGDFEFLNSEIWLKYTQQRYTSLSDIQFRLERLGYSRKDWAELSAKIQRFRKTAAIPLYMKSIGKRFWIFPADCIQRKVHQIEHVGNQIVERVESKAPFKEEFLRNAEIEEAITSAIYEGASSTRAQAKRLIASERKPSTKDEWMLINNYRAMQWIKANREQAVSTRTILNLHEIVTRNTLEKDDVNYSGKFRDDKTFVGDHEGVNHEKLEEATREAIALTTNSRRYLHGLVEGILLHYFIAYIHPFFDGNGRTARAMFYFKCIKKDLRFVELLSVSAYLKERGKRYERAFERVVKHDLDITYFVDYCLDTLVGAIEKVQDKVEYLINLNSLAKPYELNEKQVSLLQNMALNKFVGVSVEDFASQIGKSREIARQDLNGLLEKGFIQKTKVGKKFIYHVDSKELKKRVRNT